MLIWTDFKVVLQKILYIFTNFTELSTSIRTYFAKMDKNVIMENVLTNFIFFSKLCNKISKLPKSSWILFLSQFYQYFQKFYAIVNLNFVDLCRICRCLQLNSIRIRLYRSILSNFQLEFWTIFAFSLPSNFFTT